MSLDCCIVVCVQSQICVSKIFNLKSVLLIFFLLLFADTEIPTYSTYTYLNDIATIAAIAIAMISLLTSVVTVAIMVCFVIYFQKRFSAVTERWNRHMDKQQNVAHATKAVIDPKKQEKFYESEV